MSDKNQDHEQQVEEMYSSEVFLPYICNSLPTEYKCIKHPGNIVEGATLAAQRLPKVWYNLLSTFPEEVILNGKLSDLQIEGILFSCQRHHLILPDGNRAGFFLGDGTGVGKGRQIAGIIFDNFCRGRKKHVWFSISADLRYDAQRDLNDIGCFVNIIDGCQQLDKGQKAFGLITEYKTGVLFSTYSTLVSCTNKGKSSRLDQLIGWCGKDFDGCLIFDESHKAKHFIPGKESSSSKVAVAVSTIQRLLPKARVIYCSATGVTDLKNMAFMERLGFWGSGTTFNDFESFHHSLTTRGLGALEMLSMEMKAAGMYLSRGLSYHDAEFQTVEFDLTKEQIKIYNEAVVVWKELKRSLAVALDRLGIFNSRIWTLYWGSHQRFFKQLCMSMKTQEIIKLSKQALQDGYSVVIGLQTTGETSLDAELFDNHGNIDGFVSITKEILKRFISQHFPVEQPVKGELSEAGEWCAKVKSYLLNRVEKIVLLNSPLDTIIDELGGPHCVAEMTGRSGFIGRYNKSDKPSYHRRSSTAKSTESVSVQERNAFMNGEKNVAIISDAASTGISLHADRISKNQRRRIHITAELPWSADKAVQQLGRSHRSNQIIGPIYKLLTSNLGGERRFAAAVARRLQSLGAITKGDRRAATGADLSQFNFDTVYGRQALKAMYDAIAKNELCSGVSLKNVLASVNIDCSLETFHSTMKSCLYDMDVIDQNVVGGSVSEKYAKDMGKFLNRILGLEVQKQNLMFSYFCQCMETTTAAAKREGRYNDGVTDICGSSITKHGDAKTVFSEIQMGASVIQHVFVTVDRGVSFETAKEKFIKNSDVSCDFYRSKREQYGKKLYLLAVQKDLSPHLFMVTRPNTGVSPFEEDKNDLLHKYEKILPAEAEEGWNEQYETTKYNCIHGKNCKFRGVCQIGTRIIEINLLTGCILTILPALEAVIVKFGQSHGISRENRIMRVVRVKLDSGERLVGLRYPDFLIPEVERYIKEQKLLQHEKTVPRFFVESETPLNLKARSKALETPTSIKMFFKKVPFIETCSNDCGDKNDKQTSKVKTRTHRNFQVDSALKNREEKVTSVNLKRKQSSILNLFSSQSTKKKLKKEVICPICLTNFEGRTTQDINEHIDNCLIK
ncbi:uncharacterized protein LOC100210324 isoform X1 [Hydra vulgaris]|uniref:uncharacterized protein LOC100210324 isoform X1 n=1 Tax=Hydra vulgaris TaxID=6087 RepID=UPI001F5E4417|nr:protein FORGETTER 1 [Hydra vulgaris]